MQKLIFILLTVLTALSMESCNKHWDSYSTSKHTYKKARTQNANSTGKRRKKLNKSKGYSAYSGSKGGFLNFKDSYSRKPSARRPMNWKDSYSKKSKRRGTARSSSRDRNREMRWHKHKRKIRKRKGRGVAQ